MPHDGEQRPRNRTVDDGGSVLGEGGVDGTVAVFDGRQQHLHGQRVQSVVRTARQRQRWQHQ